MTKDEKAKKKQHITLNNQTKTGENCPSSEAVDFPPEALTRICFVISVTSERRSNAASSIPPIWKKVQKDQRLVSLNMT
jgi:hypothetical protein